jgi:hypothetical protein
MFHHVGVKHSQVHAGILHFFAMLWQVTGRAADHHSYVLGHFLKIGGYEMM